MRSLLDAGIPRGTERTPPKGAVLTDEPNEVPGADTTSPVVTDQVETPAVVQDASTPAPSAGAEEPSSSTDTQPKEPSSLEEAIQMAAEKLDAEATTTADTAAPAKTDEPAAKAEGEAKTEGETPADPKAELPDEPSEEELKGFSDKTKARVEKLLEQRHELRTELEAVMPEAEAFRGIREYCVQNNLTDEDTDKLFTFGAALKAGNLEEALKIAEPAIRTLLEGTGRALPKDLRTAVEEGQMTDVHARELARARTRAAIAENRTTQVTAQVQQERQTQEHVQQRQVIVQAVNQHLEVVSRTDPDFALKQPMMSRIAQAIVAERGHPRTEAEAVSYAKQAYEEATAQLRALRPAPKATKPQPSSGTNPTRSSAHTEPTSLEDVIRAALAAGS